MIKSLSIFSVSQFLLVIALFFQTSVFAARPNDGDRGKSRAGRRQNSNQNGNNGNRNNGEKDTGLFNIVNGQIFTPGLAIIDAPQPFTPMGGDFLHIALDISGNGVLPVPPRSTSDPLTSFHNITLFLTSLSMGKNFTISNSTGQVPPLANIMLQEPGSTVKHINFEWPACLVGDNSPNELVGETARGDYNISIHQSFLLNGSPHYTIFNLPISVSNSISQFPSAKQLLTNPPPGPLNALGGRMDCESIMNPMMDFGTLVRSVNNPPGQPYQDLQVQVQGPGGGQVGDMGSRKGGNGGNGGGSGDGSIGNGANTGSAGATSGMGKTSASTPGAILIIAVFGILIVNGGW